MQRARPFEWGKCLSSKSICSGDDWFRYFQAGLDVKSTSAAENDSSAAEAHMNELSLDEKVSSADVNSISAPVKAPSADDVHMNERGLDEKASSADVKSTSASDSDQSADNSHRSSNRWPHFLDHRKSFP